MNSQSEPSVWSIQQWTSAPLQLEKVIWLAAESAIVFGYLTNPAQMCRIFSWMHTVIIGTGDSPEVYGLGTTRRCHFGNDMVLEEVIVGWDPPLRYAYRSVDENHPFGMTGHLGIIECRPETTGTRLIWQHYFDHAHPTAMVKQLDESMQQGLHNLQEYCHSKKSEPGRK